MDETVYKRSNTGKGIAKGTVPKQARLAFRNRSVKVQKRIVIGRSSECDIPLPSDPLVSRRHAVIELEAGTYSIKDLGSTNSTYVNNSPIRKNKPVTLYVGDVIRIGHTEFTVQGGG
jgi:pSer/pThr/pTyr-binding forkhead associated (FHA) protein